MQLARLQISQKLLWFLSNGLHYVNDECWKITGIHLKLFICQTTKQP